MGLCDFSKAHGQQLSLPPVPPVPWPATCPMDCHLSHGQLCSRTSGGPGLGLGDLGRSQRYRKYHVTDTHDLEYLAQLYPGLNVKGIKSIFVWSYKIFISFWNVYLEEENIIFGSAVGNKTLITNSGGRMSMLFLIHREKLLQLFFIIILWTKRCHLATIFNRPGVAGAVLWTASSLSK